MKVFDPLGIEIRGVNLIEASAGTGKTYAIASLFLRLVVESSLLPENILVVTFTEAATKELRDRVRRRLREARDFFSGGASEDPFLLGMVAAGPDRWPGTVVALERIDASLQGFDSAAISTIHGFCARTLQENAFESGSMYDTELLTDQKQLLQEIVDDFWRISFFDVSAPLLAAVEKRRWTPEKLVKLLDRKVGNPQLRILPTMAAGEAEKIDRECRETYDSLTAQWRDRGGEIAAIISEHKGLSRSEKNYRLTDVVPQLLADMDTYIASGNPYQLFTGLDKFSSAFIRGQKLAKFDPPEDDFFDLCDALVNRVQRRLLLFLLELYAYAAEQLPRRKQSANIRTYDDLLLDLYHALRGEHGAALRANLQERYRAALIDEFQDTDQIQYGIFNSIYADNSLPLFLIGDPKQAIYSFRGADVFAYLQARCGLSADIEFTMKENWRSTPALVEAVNLVFGQQSQLPFVIEHLEYPQVSAARTGDEGIVLEARDAAPLQLWFFQRQEEDRETIPKGRADSRIVAAVAAEIASLLADACQGRARIEAREVTPEDIAVIVRSHYQADMTRDALAALGIPAVVQSNDSIFDSAEAGELCTILAAVAEPAAEAGIRAALVTRVFGVDGTGLDALLQDETDAEERIAAFREYHELWAEKGFMTMFRTMLRREHVQQRLMALPNGERRLTNLQQCAELIHQQAATARLGIDPTLAWFREQLGDAPEDEKYQLRLESDDRAVRIVTVHLSKGLEYPIVFCPFTWGGVREDKECALFHDGYDVVVDIGSDDFAAHARAAMVEGLAENLRLLYVALTRARFRCYLAWGKFRDSDSSAPAYLLHYPQDAPRANYLGELAQAMKGLSDQAMIERVGRLQEEGGGRIAVTVDPQPAAPERDRSVISFADNSCRSFRGEIDTSWRVASFSALSAGHRESEELPDRDQDLAAEADEAGSSPPAGSIFAFPGGTRAGTTLHAIFEELDFTSADANRLSALVQKHLDRGGFGTDHLQAVCAMVRNVVSAPLGPDGVRLSSVALDSRLTELEFFFPLNRVNSERLGRILARWGENDPILSRVAAMLNFREQMGMMLGFMDLVFCSGGKYYLVDWKSNHLGNSTAAYDRQAMAREMVRHLYPLQYLLYTVALNRYLQQRDPSYRYAEHFGGIHYIFLRGVDPARTESGVFSHIPPERLIIELTECLIAGEGY